MSLYEKLEGLGIRLNGKTSGEIVTICPQCSSDRKKKNAKCLGVNVTTGVYHCNHCGWKGKVFENASQPKKEFVKPVPRLEKLSSKALGWFQGRGISNNTLLRFGITESIEWMPQFEKEVLCVCFNYLKGEELINIKFRGPEKSFKLSKDAELIFYNLNALEKESTCVIVEGEIDCLSMYEAGVFNCISVPNGAVKGVQRLEYLDNCWEYFEAMQTVIIATDGDEPGIMLREELARRIGIEKCSKVIWPEGCKDANDVLIKFGAEKLKSVVESAVEFPIEGILTMDDMYADVLSLYENGYPSGCSANAGPFDDFMRFTTGQLTMVTGIPGSGKSEFVDWLMVLLAKHHGWPWGVCSFEVKPQFHTTKLIEKFTGKRFSKKGEDGNRVSAGDFEYGVGMVDKYFHFINTEYADITLPVIIQKAKELVKRRGIKGLVIDPWNWIEYSINRGQSETSYINEALTDLQKFIKAYDVHCFLIAHPTKLNKNPGTKKYDVPTLYNISGSANFFNKAHNGFSVYRDFQTNQITIYVQKIKDYWLGKLGSCDFQYNTSTRQYVFEDKSAPAILGSGHWRPLYETEREESE